MGKCLQDYFAMNPLEDPIVKATLREVRLSGQQLIDMSVKELNRRLAGCPSLVVGKLKKCRRTLKNRGYAKSCRIKRIVAKSELEQVNARLRAELTELRQRNRSLSEQIGRLLATSHTTASGDGGGPPREHSPFAVRGRGAMQVTAAPTITKLQFSTFDGHDQLGDGQQQQQQCYDLGRPLQHQHQRLIHESCNSQDNSSTHCKSAYHSAGSSTCNSSPESSTSSAPTVYTPGADDAAAASRSLVADLSFQLDDHELGGCRAGQAAGVGGASSMPALYTEVHNGWSIGPHQQQVVAGYH